MGDENSSTSKNYPSLPPNYVTLVQLQERWVEQQQRKQREKEEEVERKQREKEDEEERKQREEHERRNENGERSEANAFPRRRHRRQPFRKNNSWIQSEKRSSSAGESEESHIGAIVVNDGESKFDVSKNKKKKYKKKQPRNWEKPRAEQNLIPGMEKAENGDEVERIPVVSTEKDCELQGNDKNLVENGVAMGKRAAGNRSVGIGRKFAERGGNERDASNVRGGQWKVAKIPVVPTERGCELQRNGKKLVVNGVDLEKKVPVEQSVGIGGKFGELSASGGGRGGNKRDGRNLHGGLRKVEKIPMVSTERDCELLRNGKNLVVNGVDLEKKVPVEPSVGIGQKFEELSVSGGGRGGNERNGRNVRGGRQKVEKIPVFSTERDCELQGNGKILVVNGGGGGGNERDARNVRGGKRKVEKTAVVSTERDSELRGNGKNLVVNGMDLEKKVPVERSVGIGGKFEELSVSGGGVGGNERDGRNVHGSQRKVEKIPVVLIERDWELQGNGKNLVVNGGGGGDNERDARNVHGGKRKVEKIAMVSTERDCELQGNGKNLVVDGVDLEKKATMERSVEIGRKFEELSVGGGRGGNERDARNVRGSQWKYSGSSWRFNSGRPPRRPIDSNLVWVRKGDDASDASVAGV